MLARIIPGVIPPTVGTATISEVSSDPTNWADLVNYFSRISCTITVSTQPPFPSFGWRVGVMYGTTTAANTFFDSAFVNLTTGVNNIAIDITNRIKNNYYRVVVFYTDPFGNILYEVAASNSVQLTTLRWYRIRGRGVGSFTFDTTKSKCDFIVVSSGGESGTDNLGDNGGGGFGVAFKNITPLSGTFHYNLVMGSGATAFIRRDNALSTANQILGVNGFGWAGVPATSGPPGTVSDLSGVFVAPTYSTSGSSTNSGARVNGDFLEFFSSDDPISETTIHNCWGDGGISIGDVVSPSVPGKQGTYQILYYE